MLSLYIPLGLIQQLNCTSEAQGVQKSNPFIGKQLFLAHISPAWQSSSLLQPPSSSPHCPEQHDLSPKQSEEIYIIVWC